MMSRLARFFNSATADGPVGCSFMFSLALIASGIVIYLDIPGCIERRDARAVQEITERREVAIRSLQKISKTKDTDLFFAFLRSSLKDIGVDPISGTVEIVKMASGEFSITLNAHLFGGHYNQDLGNIGKRTAEEFVSTMTRACGDQVCHVDKISVNLHESDDDGFVAEFNAVFSPEDGHGLVVLRDTASGRVLRQVRKH